MGKFEKQVKERATELKHLVKKGVKIVGDSCKKGWHKVKHTRGHGDIYTGLSCDGDIKRSRLESAHQDIYPVCSYYRLGKNREDTPFGFSRKYVHLLQLRNPSVIAIKVDIHEANRCLE